MALSCSEKLILMLAFPMWIVIVLASNSLVPYVGSDAANVPLPPQDSNEINNLMNNSTTGSATPTGSNTSSNTANSNTSSSNPPNTSSPGRSAKSSSKKGKSFRLKKLRRPSPARRRAKPRSFSTNRKTTPSSQSTPDPSDSPLQATASTVAHPHTMYLPIQTSNAWMDAKPHSPSPPSLQRRNPTNDELQYKNPDNEYDNNTQLSQGVHRCKGTKEACAGMMEAATEAAPMADECQDSIGRRKCKRLFKTKKRGKWITDKKACKKDENNMAKDCAKTCNLCGVKNTEKKTKATKKSGVRPEKDNSSLLAGITLSGKGQCRNSAKDCPKTNKLLELAKCDRKKTRDYYRSNCQKSCAQCLPPKYKCADRNRKRCERLQKRGFCNLHYRAAKILYCPETCRVCTKDSVTASKGSSKNEGRDLPMARMDLKPILEKKGERGQKS